MKRGQHNSERQALATTDPSGTYCGLKDAYGASLAFHRAYRKWMIRRGLPRGNFNDYNGARKPEQ